jgi:hypothetical protein
VQPSLWLAAAFNASFDTAGQDVTLETSIASFRAVPSVELLAFEPVAFDIGGGIGLDLFHTIPRDAARPSVSLRPGQTVADPVLEGQLLTRIRVAAGARILVALDVDYDFAAHRYTSIDRAGQTTTVLEPWSLRPVAMIGLCIPLAGASACASAP